MGVIGSRASPVLGVVSSSWDAAMCDVAELAERLSHLPAIATLDWCDLAAACVLGLGGSTRACVMIATIDPDGRIRDVEATGFASHLPNDSAQLNELRCRAEGWDTLGVARVDSADQAVAVNADDNSGPGWTTSLVGRAWSELGARRVAISLGQLGPTSGGRCLVVMLTPADAAVAPVLVGELRAIIPVLVRRAILAIGPVKARRNHWISPKEMDVLHQLVLGKSVREIAEGMDRSPHTVHDHVKSLHRKLGASSRGELISRALGHIGLRDRGGMPLVDRVDYADPPARQGDSR